VTEAHACEQLAQGCYLEVDRLRFEPATFLIASKGHRGHTATKILCHTPGGLKEKEDPEELANPIRTLTATYYDCYYYL